MRIFRIEALHEPMNKDGAPTELEGPGGVVGYRDGAPTELFKSVQGSSACAKQNEAFHEPSLMVCGYQSLAKAAWSCRTPRRCRDGLRAALSDPSAGQSQHAFDEARNFFGTVGDVDGGY
jgi:hypothetical protein